MTIARVFALALCLVVGGCLTDPSSDDDLALGEEAHAVEKSAAEARNKCISPKVTLCHLPGGDPTKAVNLCIAPAAVDTHQFHHGDSLGECPEAPRCSSHGGACGEDSDCCDGFCAGGSCVLTCQPTYEACDSNSDCCNGGGCFFEVCIAQV
jgi:hypothetical protein